MHGVHIVVGEVGRPLKLREIRGGGSRDRLRHGLRRLDKCHDAACDKLRRKVRSDTPIIFAISVTVHPVAIISRAM